MVKTKKRASTAKLTAPEEEPITKESIQAESDGDSSSSEEGPEWTADDEKAFLKTLGALKSKTESIYDNNKNFWNKEVTSTQTSAKPSKKEKAKTMFLKDYERKLVLEKEGQIDESDEDEDRDTSQQPGYYEEQDAIKKQFKAVMDDIEEDDGDTLFKKREKTTEDKTKEESDYYDWIKNNNKSLKVEKEIESLKEVWENPQLEEDDKFLRDYLLNKDYETDQKTDIPTYDEIVEEGEDEEQLEREREYERKYNFRYEDPDQEFIKQYPRTVNESLRRDDKKTKRKEKRLTKREEKLKEKKEKIKTLKKKQGTAKSMIEEKLRRLKEITGEDIPLSIDDLKGDFDPAEYDKRMQELFNDKYYGEDVNYDDDEQKPVFSDMEDFDDDGLEKVPVVQKKKLSEKEQSGKNDLNQEDAAVVNAKIAENSDDDDDDDDDYLGLKNHRRKESKRKLKRRKLLEESKKKKPLFDPSEKTFEEYFNEYYAMEFEDLIDDQPTRFRYRSVIPNDFGLTADEILNADEKNLNSWASVKKAISYRSDEQEQYDVQAYKKKSRNLAMKKKILGNLDKKENVEFEDEQADGEKNKKKKGKLSAQEMEGTEQHDKTTSEKEVEEQFQQTSVEQPEVESNKTKSGKVPRRRKKKLTSTDGKLSVDQKPEEQVSQPATKKSQKRNKSEGASPKNQAKKKRFAGSDKKQAIPSVTDERLRAYGINPKKFNAKMKYRKNKTEGDSAPL